MEVTLQKLSNILAHSWELQRELGFHMQTPKDFREHINKMSEHGLRFVLESLGLLFRETQELGKIRIAVVPVIDENDKPKQ